MAGENLQWPSDNGQLNREPVENNGEPTCWPVTECKNPSLPISKSTKSWILNPKSDIQKNSFVVYISKNHAGVLNQSLGESLSKESQLTLSWYTSYFMQTGRKDPKCTIYNLIWYTILTVVPQGICSGMNFHQDNQYLLSGIFYQSCEEGERRWNAT